MRVRFLQQYLPIVAHIQKKEGFYMVYSDITKSGEVLPKKEKYTKKDFIKLVNAGIPAKKARFICICSAVYHDTQYSDFFDSLECFAFCRMA